MKRERLEVHTAVGGRKKDSERVAEERETRGERG